MYDVGDIIKINNIDYRNSLNVGEEFIVVKSTSSEQRIKQISGDKCNIGRIWIDSTQHLEHYDKIG